MADMDLDALARECAREVCQTDRLGYQLRYPAETQKIILALLRRVSDEARIEGAIEALETARLDYTKSTFRFFPRIESLRKKLAALRANSQEAKGGAK